MLYSKENCEAFLLGKAEGLAALKIITLKVISEIDREEFEKCIDSEIAAIQLELIKINEKEDH